eukprot:scaffold4629_cov48-Attheya_sp.AAC.1
MAFDAIALYAIPVDAITLSAVDVIRLINIVIGIVGGWSSVIYWLMYVVFTPRVSITAAFV